MVTVTVDTSQFDSMSVSLAAAINNAGEGLLQAIETTVMSDLSLLSATIWNVRTGTYAYGWFAQQIGQLSVLVDNMAIYAQELETGWTTKNGGFIMGGDVLGQAIITSEGALGGMIESWIQNQIGA